MKSTIHQLLQHVDPVDESIGGALDAAPTADAASALRDAIAATDRDSQSERAPERGHRRRARLAALGLATTAAAVLAVLAITDLGSVGPSPDPGGGQAWAAAAVRVAREVPRLLPTEPGWKVERADEMRVENGSTTLTNGDRAVEYNWYPRSQYAMYFKDRQQGTQRFTDVEIAGVTAAMFRYDDTDDYFAMWRLGDYFVEARTQPDIPEQWRTSGIPEGGPEAAKVPKFVTHFDEASFRSFVTSLRSVDVETWLAAMPESVVKPQDNAAMVAKMLDGVPVPKGFRPESVAGGSEIRDRHHLGASVSSALLCAWFREWRAADQAGEMDRAAAAKRAVGTAPDWPVMRLMAEEGAFPELVGSDARRFAQGQTPGKGISFEDFWRRQFCQSR